MSFISSHSRQVCVACESQSQSHRSPSLLPQHPLAYRCSPHQSHPTTLRNTPPHPPTQPNPQRFYNGSIAHLFIFDEALTGDQVRALYQTGVTAGQQATSPPPSQEANITLAADPSPTTNTSSVVVLALAPVEEPAVSATVAPAGEAAPAAGLSVYVPAADCTSGCQLVNGAYMCATSAGLIRACQQAAAASSAPTAAAANASDASPYAAVSSRGELWAVGCGLWAVGCGLWAVGCGLWAVGCPLPTPHTLLTLHPPDAHPPPTLPPLQMAHPARAPAHPSGAAPATLVQASASVAWGTAASPPAKTSRPPPPPPPPQPPPRPQPPTQPPPRSAKRLGSGQLPPSAACRCAPPAPSQVGG